MSVSIAVDRIVRNLVDGSDFAEKRFSAIGLYQNPERNSKPGYATETSYAGKGDRRSSPRIIQLL